MSRGRWGVIACSLWAFLSEAHAGTASLEKRPDIVRLTGIIEEGDVERLSAILARVETTKTGTAPPRVTIEFNSPGGNFLEGIRLGLVIRAYGAATVVRRQDRCLSACAIAFLGGTSTADAGNPIPDRALEVGGKVGFHPFFLNPSALQRSDRETYNEGAITGFNQARGAAERLADYFATMGIDGDFVARMLGRRPSDQFDYVDTVERFIKFSVCPLGIGRPAIPIAQQAINLSNNLTSLRHLPGSTPVATPIPAERARRHLLEVVQAGMMASRVKGALSDQLASYAVMRNARAIENLYDDLRAAGLALPEIVGPTFEISGYRAGMYDLRTIVSLSLDNPDRFDLVTVGVRGMAPPSHQPPPACPRLFLYERQLMLNP